MSGWIKLEKDLREDLRVKRIAAQLIKSGTCNAGALRPAAAVTQVLGALAQLWMHADSFAREDDTLDITRHEIDELTGIQGFAQFLPADWLEILDSERVKLPGFQAHNGTTAKRKDQTAKRVSKHRAAKRNASPLPSTTTGNADALPDQTKTRPDLDQKNPSASATPTRKLASRETSAEEDPEWLLDFKLAYPNRAGDQGWRKAVRAAHARMADGHTSAEFIAGARRYAVFCEASGKTGTEFVKQACTFLGPDKAFLLPWHAPPKPETASERILRTLNGSPERTVIEHDPERTALTHSR